MSLLRELGLRAAHHCAFLQTVNGPTMGRGIAGTFKVRVHLQPMSTELPHLPVPLVLAPGAEIPQAHRAVLRSGHHKLSIRPKYLDAGHAVSVGWYRLMSELFRSSGCRRRLPRTRYPTAHYCVALSEHLTVCTQARILRTIVTCCWTTHKAHPCTDKGGHHSCSPCPRFLPCIHSQVAISFHRLSPQWLAACDLIRLPPVERPCNFKLCQVVNG
jgi:hypothetical protein